MATNKNFTMQQYNGTDYDVLYPKNTSQQTLLNDSTLATALGLTATNPEIDQALTEIVSKITALENGAVKIQTGSYVGTGTYGSSNPCSLTFDFPATMVWCWRADTPFTASNFLEHSGNNNWPYIGFLPLVSLNTNYSGGYDVFTIKGFGSVGGLSTTYSLYGKRSEDYKTISWYNNIGSSYQNNSNSLTYNWIAIG